MRVSSSIEIDAHSDNFLYPIWGAKSLSGDMMETLTINSLLSCVLTVILQLLLGMFLVWHGNFALGDKRPLRGAEALNYHAS